MIDGRYFDITEIKIEKTFLCKYIMSWKYKDINYTKTDWICHDRCWKNIFIHEMCRKISCCVEIMSETEKIVVMCDIHVANRNWRYLWLAVKSMSRRREKWSRCWLVTARFLTACVLAHHICLVSPVVKFLWYA